MLIFDLLQVVVFDKSETIIKKIDSRKFIDLQTNVFNKVDALKLKIPIKSTGHRKYQNSISYNINFTIFPLLIR